jgi:esterase FrsA
VTGAANIWPIALSAVGMALLVGLAVGSKAVAQERTLEELKVETQARANRGAFPLEGLKPEDVHEALGRLKTLDRDEWAASWSIIGDRYMSKAQAELSASPAEADKDLVEAWRYYNFARWPVEISPGKKKAYEHALEAYLAHGRLLDPPLEVVHIPFEGKEIVGYVRMPKGGNPAPIVFAINGLDSRKEEMAEKFGPMLDYGVGYFACDAPGTGQAPIKSAPGAERMLTKALDYVFQRPDVDKNNVVIYGGSLGGYWSAVLAATEYNRARAAVEWSGPLHETFQRVMVMNVPHNREYLFDYLPALVNVYEKATDLETLADARAAMSIKTRGFLDKPMAPMLVIGGVLDSQVPISDTDLILHNGQTPKEAWINPQGGHMGRDLKGWSDARILRTVVVPWILREVGIKTE